MTTAAGNHAFWLSSANPMMVEVARDHGFRVVVLDLEHGIFDQSRLDFLIPFCRASGFEVYAKVLGPEAVPIQQALDFGASGVIVPHVEDVEQARRVTAYAKYPPLGTRSYAAGRIVDYGATPDGFFAATNAAVKCFPMIESSAALADVEDIVSLPTVDGLFVGPTDLALSRGRTDYRFDAEDRADIERIARAAQTGGKPWIMPAWTQAERRFSVELGVEWMVVLNEHAAVTEGMRVNLAAIAAEVRA